MMKVSEHTMIVKKSFHVAADCFVTALATTPLVVYGGFVDNVHTDKVQTTPPDGQSLQQFPTQLVPSYLGFTVCIKESTHT